MSDHVFDEWELCASDFSTHDGHHTHFKEREINITFLYQECSSLTTGDSLYQNNCFPSFGPFPSYSLS